MANSDFDVLKQMPSFDSLPIDFLPVRQAGAQGKRSFGMTVHESLHFDFGLQSPRLSMSRNHEAPSESRQPPVLSVVEV